MDYAKLYNALISFRKSNPLKKSKELYTEKHHIVPKCLGGSNSKSNLIRLTAREHFIAHRLLAKIYPEERGLVLVVVMMLSTREGVKIASSRAVSTMREQSSEFMKECWTEEKRKEVSGRMSGNGNRYYGKVGDSHPAFGHNKSQAFKEMVSGVFREYWSRPENKERMKSSKKEFWSNQENRRLASECKMGERNPNYGKDITSFLTPEQIAARGRKSSETRKSKFPPDSLHPDHPRHMFWEKADLLSYHLKKSGLTRVTKDILLSVYGVSDQYSRNNANHVATRIFKYGWEPLDDDRWIQYTELRFSRIIL